MVAKGRFTDSNKWEKQWFFDLEPIDKLIVFYLYDNCDNAGFYEINIRKLAFETGIPVEKVDMEKYEFAEIRDGVLWLKGFLYLQYPKGLSAGSPPHKHVIKLSSHWSELFPEGMEIVEDLLKRKTKIDEERTKAYMEGSNA